MGLVKISELPSASVLTGAELLELSQGGFSRKGTASLFAVLNLSNVFTVFQTIRSTGGVNLRIENTGASIISYFGVDGSAGYAGTSSNHAFNLYTSNAARIEIAAAGNITINAPSSGNALTVNGFTAIDTGAITQSIQEDGSGALLDISGSNNWRIYTSGSERIRVGNTGNITINAPSSGVALTVAGVAGTRVSTFNGGNAAGAYSEWQTATTPLGYVGDAAAVVGTATGNFSIGAATGLALYLGSGGASRIAIAAAGIVTINAPSSDTALILPAAATGYSSMRLPHGAAPSAPVNGDMWTTTAGLFVRINGATVGPLT